MREIDRREGIDITYRNIRDIIEDVFIKTNSKFFSMRFKEEEIGDIIQATLRKCQNIIKDDIEK